MLGLDVTEKLAGIDKVKLGIALLGVVFALAVVFGAGWVVNGWRLEGGHAQAIVEKDRIIANLNAAILTQNAANDLLHEKKIAADERRKLAADMSKSVLDGIEAKAARAASSTATDCDGVLREAHGDAR